MTIVYNMDCLEAMRLMNYKEFDLAIVDVPYGIGAPDMQMGSAPNRKGKNQYPGTSTTVKLKNRLNSGGGHMKNSVLVNSYCSWDTPPPEEYWRELFRVSKNQIIWGGNYFHLPPSRGIIVWDKLQPWENFSQVEIAWTSFDCPAKIFRLSNTGGRNNEKKIHPTQKPVKLYSFCLQKFAKKGDKILDTHVGSGSSRIASDMLGFDFTGFEKSKLHFLDQEKRFNDYKSQLTINFNLT